jgi:hypothetical protein
MKNLPFLNLCHNKHVNFSSQSFKMPIQLCGVQPSKDSKLIHTNISKKVVLETVLEIIKKINLSKDEQRIVKHQT